MAEAAAPGKSFTVSTDEKGRPCLAYAQTGDSPSLYGSGVYRSLVNVPVHITPGRIAPDDPASFWTLDALLKGEFAGPCSFLLDAKHEIAYFRGSTWSSPVWHTIGRRLFDEVVDAVVQLVSYYAEESLFDRAEDLDDFEELWHEPAVLCYGTVVGDTELRNYAIANNISQDPSEFRYMSAYVEHLANRGFNLVPRMCDFNVYCISFKAFSRTNSKVSHAVSKDDMRQYKEIMKECRHVSASAFIPRYIVAYRC